MRISFQKLTLPIYIFSAAAFTQVRPNLEKTDSQNTIKDSIPTKDFQFQHPLRDSHVNASQFSNSIFTRAQLSKTECFVGEPVIVTYKLYSSLNSRSKVISETTAQGFSKVNLPTEPDQSAQTELYEGRKYQVHTLKTSMLIPQFTGNLEIGQIEMIHKLYLTKKNVQGKHKNEIDDFIKGMSRSESSTRPISYQCKSLPTRLIVHELPNPTQDGFSGAIGTFQITSQFPVTTIRAGEIINLTVTINGIGSLEGVEAPTLSLPTWVKLISVKQVVGSKGPNPHLAIDRKFEYVLSVEDAKSFILPPILFRYFDSKIQKYQTIKTGKLPIRVVGSILRNVNPEISKQGNRYILYTLLSLIIAVTMLALFVRKKRTNRRLKNVEKKPSVADEQLLNIERQIQAGDLSSFNNLNALLWNAFSKSLELRPTDLTRKNVLRELGRRGWNTPERLKAEFLINSYEEYLYLPGMEKIPDLQQTFVDTRDVLSKLEENRRHF